MREKVLSYSFGKDSVWELLVLKKNLAIYCKHFMYVFFNSEFPSYIFSIVQNFFLCIILSIENLLEQKNQNKTKKRERKKMWHISTNGLLAG